MKSVNLHSLALIILPFMLILDIIFFSTYMSHLFYWKRGEAKWK